MAFSFTLSELQAELRALGCDGVPDHVILSLLSNLSPPCSLTPPPCSSSASLDSSGFDTEASSSTTFSLPQFHERPKAPNSGPCGGFTDSSTEFVDTRSDNRALCQKNYHDKVKARHLRLDNRISACALTEAPLCEGGNGCLESTEEKSVFYSASNARRRKGSASPKAKSRPRSMIRQKLSRRPSSDEIIEHYWISVGQEHMRAMNKSNGKKERLTRFSDRDLQNFYSMNGKIQGKTGYKTLIEKVEQCEDELQCLTRRLKAQQFEKQWLSQAARYAGGATEGQAEAGLQVDNPIQDVDSVTSGKHVQGPHNRARSSIISAENAHTITEITGEGFKRLSLEDVKACLGAPLEDQISFPEGNISDDCRKDRLRKPLDTVCSSEPTVNHEQRHISSNKGRLCKPLDTICSSESTVHHDQGRITSNEATRNLLSDFVQSCQSTSCTDQKGFSQMERIVADSSEISIQDPDDVHSPESTYDYIQECMQTDQSCDAGAVTVQVFTDTACDDLNSSTSNSIQVCQEKPCNSAAISQEGCEELIDKLMNETHLLETEVTGIVLETVCNGGSDLQIDKDMDEPCSLEKEAVGTPFVSEKDLEVSMQYQDQKVTVSDLNSEQVIGAVSSTCNKPTTTTYRRLRSSGDLKTSASQIGSPHSSPRRHPHSILQNQKRRAGKIDRVARYTSFCPGNFEPVSW
ncbi:hypothetical protein KP509_08G070800 [Ceratopteris richardii]|uniref:Uncharacterized protein n=1 Tax=Ceratopteris richardii TaxID=49495 RepID=A0A8T2UED1_CERRI|nr:hypothetical protein KP509_08G070800 [Ceratopteris richardii]